MAQTHPALHASLPDAHPLLDVLEGLELLLSSEEEESPELDDAEESESSLAGLLGGGEMRAACMWQMAFQHSIMHALTNHRTDWLKAH